MTDERYIYVQTQKERKQIANGARGRKGSRGPKSCKMPSDYMTRKEKLALNSEVTTWDMKQFYEWAAFRKMPKDLQVQYLNRLTTVYNVPFSAITKYVFECSDSAFWCLVDRNNLRPHLNPTARSNKPGKDRLKKDVAEAREPKPIVVDENTEPVETESTSSTVLTHASFEMNGFDRDFLDILEQRFGYQDVRVSITVEVVC